MEIFLKTFVENIRLNKVSRAFSIDLHIDGKKAARISQDGNNNPSILVPVNPRGLQLLLKAQNYIKALFPDRPDRNLHYFINERIDQILKDKDLNYGMDKINKAMPSSIVYGKLDDTVYHNSYKRSIPEILETETGKKFIRLELEKVKEKLKPGHALFNTNIPAALVPEGMKQVVLKKRTINLEQKPLKFTTRGRGH